MSGNGASQVKLTKKDFVSDQAVRWCPGCGDYAILAQMQKVMPELGISRENVVFVSGIGCSSRFPYYMNTYGFHTIHGRAPAIATGLKLMRPELSVWVVTGDGDALSIGGNHLIHMLRRNVDLKVLLFNNKVYGLTKGQYSPTSDVGMVTKTSPDGVFAQPFQTLSLALGAEASFVARAVDTEVAHLQEMIRRMAEHKGTAFLEIYQNCPVFNDGQFEGLKDRATKTDQLLFLKDGEPLVYGADGDRILKLNPHLMQLYASRLGVRDEGFEVRQNEANPDPTLAMLLSRCEAPEFPVPLGVLRAVDRPTFDEQLNARTQAHIEAQGRGTLAELLDAGDRWTV
jgi:2-oxoglutarate ferredoxin oxidoreductase subunit beta